MVASPTGDCANGGQLDSCHGHWCYIHRPAPVNYCCLCGKHCVPGGRRGGEGASRQSLVDVVVAGTAVQVSQ